MTREKFGRAVCFESSVVSQWSYPGLKYALERFSGISRNVGLGVAGSWLCHLLTMKLVSLFEVTK